MRDRVSVWSAWMIVCAVWALACVAPNTSVTPEQQPAEQPQTSSPQTQALGQQAAATGGEVVLDRHAPSGLMLPRGWTVNVQQQGAASQLTAAERPGADDSPGIGLIVMPAGQGVSASGAMQMMLGNQAIQARVISTRQINPTTQLVEATIVSGGVPGRMALLGAESGQSVALAFFVATPARYQQLGGAALLARVVNLSTDQPQPTPARQPTPSPAPTGPVKIHDYNTQISILDHPATLPAKTLQGAWSGGMSVPTGSVYQSVTSGTLSYGSLGHGHLFEFRPDGTYAWAYQYAHNFQGCRNAVQSMEHGTYRFDGTTLTLKPKTYDADLCACCTRPTKMRPSGQEAARTYQVAFHPSGRYAVLKGSCTRPTRTSCVGPEGGKYLRIGLQR